MVTNKLFTCYNYLYIVNHTILPLIIHDLDQRANKAFGQIIFFLPKESKHNFATSEIISKPLKKINNKLFKIIKFLHYESNN